VNRGFKSFQSLVPNKRESIAVLTSINAIGQMIPIFDTFEGVQKKRDIIALYKINKTMAMKPNA